MNEERTEIIRDLAPISLNRGINPFDLTFDEALEALAHPSHLSEEVSTEKAYMFLSQYKDRVQKLLEGAIEGIKNDIRMIHHLEDFIEWGAPDISNYLEATDGLVAALQKEKEFLQ